GAIQDHDIGLVVGTSTWGKGLVQTVYNLSYGTGLALTTAKYYTPSGRLIQRDYSSYFDYLYNRIDNIASVDGVPELSVDHPEFSTDLGRTVYGGGGITPDVVVEPPEGPAMLQFLFARGAFFDFAVDYQNRHTIDDPGWSPGDKLLDEFREWLVTEEIATDEDLEEVFADAESRTFARTRIQADVFNSAFGAEASHRVLAAEDTQIQAALGLFDQAAELLNERHGLGKGR
ncbi:MAG: S41 family peptidase, partial [bacterium]|nr:S41 family peptidase [bacterium]